MLYISFAEQDAALAKQLARALEERGNRVWASWEVPVGVDYYEKVANALRDCSGFILLVSRAPTSAWRRSELHVARARREQEAEFPILPVLVGDIAPSAVPRPLANLATLRAPDAKANSGVFDLAELSASIDRVLHPHRSQASASSKPRNLLSSIADVVSAPFMRKPNG